MRGLAIGVALVLVLAAAAKGQVGGTRLVLDVDGTRLTAEAWGEGSTIVAIPGLGLDISWFRFIGPRLASAGFRFVAVNPRGIDGSEGDLDGLTLDRLAGDVAGVVAALGVESAHLVGWAFGNRIARATAAHHPDRVATVTLLAAGGKVPPTQATQEARTRLQTETALPDSTRARLMRETYFSPSSDPLAIIARVAPGSWPRASAAQREAAATAELDTWWPGGSKPLLVVQGVDDMTAPPANGHVLREEFPDRVNVIDLERSGHFLLVEQPAEVTAALVSFLRDHPIG